MVSNVDRTFKMWKDNSDERQVEKKGIVCLVMGEDDKD